MASRRAWRKTVARREVVAVLTGQGLTARAIAERLSVCMRTVQRDRVATGLAQPAAVPLTAAQLEEGARLEEAGVHPEEIARSIECSNTTAGKYWPAHKLADYEKGVLGRCANLAAKVLR